MDAFAAHNCVSSLTFQGSRHRGDVFTGVARHPSPETRSVGTDSISAVGGGASGEPISGEKDPLRREIAIFSQNEGFECVSWRET